MCQSLAKRVLNNFNYRGVYYLSSQDPYEHIDLTFIDSPLTTHINWAVHPCHNDYFPIIFHSNIFLLQDQLAKGEFLQKQNGVFS